MKDLSIELRSIFQLEYAAVSRKQENLPVLNAIIFFTTLLIILYSVVVLVATWRGYERKIHEYLRPNGHSSETVITVLVILGVPLVVSMVIALPELAVPLSSSYESCKLCGADVQSIIKPNQGIPASCDNCTLIDHKEAPPGYVFVVSMIIIFITLELSQLNTITRDVRTAWFGLLTFSLVLDILASAVLVMVKYDQYNEIERVYVIGGLAFIASFLVIVLSRIDDRYAP